MLANELKNVIDRDFFDGADEINAQLYFAENMLHKYNWTVEKKGILNKLLCDIKNKYDDSRLNLAVVGEFSNGKSTFINALLRKDILVTKMLQGTTVAATIIECGSENEIIVRYTDGKTEQINFDTVDEMKEKIASLTTGQDDAQKIHTVRVQLSDCEFNSSVRIIDTPGTNVEHLWHEEVTVRTIREVADASVILLDATQILPQSTINFIRNNLESTLSKCVWVITKADLVRPRERKQLKEYVKFKLNQEFSVKNPVVFLYSSVDVLKKSSGEEYNEELTCISGETEKSIFEFLSERKNIIQTEKIVNFTCELYSFIEENLNKIVLEYDNEILSVKKECSGDATDIAGRMSEKYPVTFKENWESRKERLYNKKYEQICGLCNIVSGAEGPEMNSKKLKAFFSTDFSKITADGLERLFYELYNELGDALNTLCTDLAKEAQNGILSGRESASENLKISDASDDFNMYYLNQLRTGLKTGNDRFVYELCRKCVDILNSATEGKSFFEKKITSSKLTASQTDVLKVTLENTVRDSLVRYCDKMFLKIISDADVFYERAAGDFDAYLKCLEDKASEHAVKIRQASQARLRFIDMCKSGVEFDLKNVRLRKEKTESALKKLKEMSDDCE